jgi:bifunctional DNA-binding transcriptional regulator/antitoxin component of YhaV-PrlF toxin-antitoxin module
MIQMFNVPVSKDGTVQLPEELHELLDGDKLRNVIFLVRNDGAVHLVPLTMTFEEAQGSLPPRPGDATIDLDEEIEEAIELALLEKYG